MYRQGDVLLVPMERPKDLGTLVRRKRGQGIILAAGEATATTTACVSGGHASTAVAVAGAS